MSDILSMTAVAARQALDNKTISAVELTGKPISRQAMIQQITTPMFYEHLKKPWIWQRLVMPD